jgi:hypothetical protein
MFGIPIYFQVTEDASVASAGSRLIPAIVGNALGGLLAGFIIRRSVNLKFHLVAELIKFRNGRYKYLSIVGPICSLLGFLLLILQWNGRTNLLELMYTLPGGIGNGMAQSTTFVQLAAGVEPSEIAVAGSSLYLCQNLGMISGFSVVSFVLQSTLKSGLAKSLHGIPNSREVSILLEIVRFIVIIAYY